MKQNQIDTKTVIENQIKLYETPLGSKVEDLVHSEHKSIERVVHIYKNDVLVTYKIQGKRNYKPGIKGKIKSYTKSSQNKLKIFLRNTHCEWHGWATLTYGHYFPLDGKEVKKHLYNFIRVLRYRYPGLKYWWRMEFQERGAPHFHIFFSYQIPQDVTSDVWSNVIGTTSCNLVRSRHFDSAEEGAEVSEEYGAKEEKNEPAEGFHNSGRFWGSNAGKCKALARVGSGAPKAEVLQEFYAKCEAEPGFAEGFDDAADLESGSAQNELTINCSYKGKAAVKVLAELFQYTSKTRSLEELEAFWGPFLEAYRAKRKVEWEKENRPLYNESSKAAYNELSEEEWEEERVPRLEFTGNTHEFFDSCIRGAGGPHLFKRECQKEIWGLKPFRAKKSVLDVLDKGFESYFKRLF
jgi:hypothetical protein